jgi:hypothetical protein
VQDISQNKKFDYIHFNPVRGKWNPAKDYLNYYYSSAGLMQRVEEFGFDS